jgi:two-component system phosphate regulon response regulator PhoB
MGEPAQGRVLVVDDDEQLAGLLQVVLSSEGYEVALAADAATALEKARGESFDLVVLDISLGEDDGRAVLAELHKSKEIPVIFISGLGDPADRVLGLRLGADDYLVKPFAPMELVARVGSVLRRSRRGGAVTPAASDREGIMVDEVTREVRVEGTLVELTAKEFDLLAFLARSPRQVFTRGQLLEQVWSSRSGWQDEATVTEHMRRLRRKVEKDPEQPRWLKTVRGVGYRFEP